MKFISKLQTSIWVKHYLKQMMLSFLFRNRGKTTTHLLFLTVDHFELAGKEPRLQKWIEGYPKLASGFRDSDGNNPKHTWFYAMDLLNDFELSELKKLTNNNFGEVELHWHHAHDNSESFQIKLETGLFRFQQHGYLKPFRQEDIGCFGFIHGNWSLDNSCGDEFCGVDNEIHLLQKNGCYGDFTFPALYSRAQPPLVNSIYYAKDNRRPKSYFKGEFSKVGRESQKNELMIFQGPLCINFKDWHYKWHPTIENGEIGIAETHGNPKRIDSWVKQNIHVRGRSDWVFVKVFCHGGQDYKYVISETTRKMHEYLNNKFNDGINFKLHYVTAREAFNIVKAAENGCSGNPNDFRDYVIPKAR